MDNQVLEAAAIYAKYVGPDYKTRTGHSLVDVAGALYQSDSEVWKMYVRKKPDGDYHRDLEAARGERGIFASIAAKIQHPDRVITECFSMISELVALIQKYEIAGDYTHMQAMALAAIVLQDFASAVFPNETCKQAYWRNAAAVEFYNQYWMPYEKYMVQNGFWEKQPAAKNPDSMSAKEMLDEIRNDPKNTSDVPDKKSGCLGWFIGGWIVLMILLFLHECSKHI